MNRKLLLIDGHNFLFRGYYGVPIEAKRPDGTQINAIYGFFALFRGIIHSIKPDYVLIIFDSETSIDTKKTMCPEYKSNRIPQNNVYKQLPLIKKCLQMPCIQSSSVFINLVNLKTSLKNAKKENLRRSLSLFLFLLINFK